MLGVLRIEGCRCRNLSTGISILLLATSLCAAPSGGPAVRIYDGSGGATCDDFDKSLGLPWLHRGGDWTDAKGVAQGADAFAKARVPGVIHPAPVEFDVTRPLVGSVDSGRFSGFLISGVGGSEVKFASRENKDTMLHPELLLTDASGHSTRLEPRADTFTNCTSNSSLGTQELIRAGAGQAAILDFDVTPETANKAVKATLRLYPLGVYGQSGLLSVYLLGGRASEFPGDSVTGIAATMRESQLADHSDVLFVERFENSDWETDWSVLGPKSDATQLASERGFEPLQGKALKVTIRSGTKLGLDLRYLFQEKLGYEPEEAYLRYYVRFADDWETPVDGGKLPGLSGTYGRAGWGGRTPDGYNGWNMRMLFRRQPPMGHPEHNSVVIGTEASIPEIPGVQKEGYYTWADGYLGVLKKNRWYCIEQYVKLNAPGKSDGIVRGWVDGRLAFEQTNLVYRQTPALKIEQVWMNVYHGGQDPTPRDISMYIDNVVVARQYIGPFDRNNQ